MRKCKFSLPLVKIRIALNAVLSPPRPQELTSTAHLLVLPNLCPTFFLKAFFAAYLLTQTEDMPIML